MYTQDIQMYTDHDCTFFYNATQNNTVICF